MTKINFGVTADKKTSVTNRYENQLFATARTTPRSALERLDSNQRRRGWILLENNHPIGYAIAHADDTMLTISNLVLQQGIDAAEACAAVAAELKSAYVKVVISRSWEMTSLRRAGYHVAHPTWEGFMIKPLVPKVTIEDARRLYGIGTDRFLVSWLDVT